jgi:hypothetical protein
MIERGDPAIQRIRDVRHQISEAHDHDPRKIVNYYLELQKKYYLEKQTLIPNSRDSTANSPVVEHDR